MRLYSYKYSHIGRTGGRRAGPTRPGGGGGGAKLGILLCEGAVLEQLIVRISITSQLASSPGPIFILKLWELP